MADKIVVLPVFNKLAPKLKELILEKIDRDLSEEDMMHAKEIRLHVVENKYLVEIDWKSDVVEIQKKDLPLSIKKQLV